MLRRAAFAVPIAAIASAASAQPPRAVSVDPGETRKICQVVGETDRESGRPTVNRTESRYGFWGTDLGASFEHEGRLILLFGDTHASGRLARDGDRDLVAVSTDATPDDCLEMTVVADVDGGYRPLTIPGVGSGAFGVPTGGFSANGAIYVVATTDFTAENPMGRSVLARSDDGGRTFERRYDLSTRRFINVAPVAVDGAHLPGLPSAEPGVLLWASGRYRRSDPYLAVVDAARADERSAIRYFAGLDAAGAPRWSADESDSAALFRQPCLGELSVAWIAPIRRWVMLYNCEEGHNRILMRTAERPWGPWSEPQVAFDPEPAGAFCGFMHPGRPRGVGERPCPEVSDPHTPRVRGDVYGPYLIARFTRGTDDGADIHFLMSTWNPYTVVLMRATLRGERLVAQLDAAANDVVRRAVRLALKRPESRIGPERRDE